MISWIGKQIEDNIFQFDDNMETYNPGSKRYLRDPKSFLSRIVDESNYLDAVKMVNWDDYIPDKCDLLDLAGGTGWLSAYLSRHENVSKIYLVDSSKYYLQKMLPGIIELMNGNNDKIIPIEGLFSPMYFEDNSLDVVVVCSSLHHAENMGSLLKEIKRVLKDRGFLLILNETPHGYWGYLSAVAKQFIRILLNTLLRRHKEVSPSISSSGYLYDPYLQDKAYPMWYWNVTLKKAGFNIANLIKTGLFTLKSDKKGLPLTHFICVKNDVGEAFDRSDKTRAGHV